MMVSVLQNAGVADLASAVFREQRRSRIVERGNELQFFEGVHRGLLPLQMQLQMLQTQFGDGM